MAHGFFNGAAVLWGLGAHCLCDNVVILLDLILFDKSLAPSCVRHGDGKVSAWDGAGGNF